MIDYNFFLIVVVHNSILFEKYVKFNVKKFHIYKNILLGLW